MFYLSNRLHGLYGSAEIELLQTMLNNAGYESLAAKVLSLKPSTVNFLLEMAQAGKLGRVINLMAGANVVGKITPAGAAVETGIIATGIGPNYASYVAAVLRQPENLGLISEEVIATMPYNLTAEQGIAILNSLKSQNKIVTEKLIQKAAASQAGKITTIIARQAQPLVKFLKSPNFAAITGLLSIAYDSAQITQAVADASDAMDEAQRTGRLTQGAVNKAFSSLPTDLQQSVTSIKNAQNMINGYTVLKYNTQQLLKNAKDQSQIDSYQGIIAGANQKISALSTLLDTMRQVQPAQKKPADGKAQAANAAGLFKQQYQQWLSMSNQHDSAQGQALFNQLVAQHLSPSQYAALSSAQVQGVSQMEAQSISDAIANNMAAMAMNAQVAGVAASGGATGATEAQNFPGIPSYDTGDQFLTSQPITTGPTDQPTSSCFCGSCVPPVYCSGSHPECCDQHGNTLTHRIPKRRRRHVRGIGYEPTDLQERAMASTLPAAIGAVIGLAMSSKGNRKETMMMGAAAGFLFGFVVTRK